MRTALLTWSVVGLDATPLGMKKDCGCEEHGFSGVILWVFGRTGSPSCCESSLSSAMSHQQRQSTRYMFLRFPLLVGWVLRRAFQAPLSCCMSSYKPSLGMESGLGFHLVLHMVS